MSHLLWKTKLAAWLHDPAEKALVLLRDKTGHEWGTVANLRERLFGSRAIPSDIVPFLERADWYASAADRPQFPRGEGDQHYARWAQVDFAQQPVLKHPLTGEEFPLQPLGDIPIEDLKQTSEAHFASLIQTNQDGAPDWRKTQLAYWRFGPQTPESDIELHHLWQNLPADTRVPDHTIWSHLDTVSAFAGAMALDKDHTASLLSVSFGPVQGFIAEARSISDLWAGSHLLARIAWEGMRVLADQLGPDAFVFPNLRGVPLVDIWLRDDMGLDPALFDDEDWADKNQGSDANALFAAALPNRFVAIVPADQAQSLAEQIEQRVQAYIGEIGDQALEKLLDAIGEEPAEQHCYTQLAQQLRGFPEVHWAAVPWTLAEGQPDSKGRVPAATTGLRPVLGNFYPEGEQLGFIDSPAWQLLSRDLSVDGVRFYQPNPGTLYPALYELLDRLAAAAKSTRPFDQLQQQGYRSTLNGEREWLTLQKDELSLPPGQREDTLWARLSEVRPAWARPGEHLDALMTIKRLWPTLFAEWVSEKLDADVRRYVVSTHTLALSVSLDRWLDAPAPLSPRIRQQLEEQEPDYRVALPRRLLQHIRKLPDALRGDAELLCRVLPGLYDRDEEDGEPAAGEIARVILPTPPEAYYGVLLFDGDRMGAWLAGNEDQFLKPFGEAWHPAIASKVKQRFTGNPDIERYLGTLRPPSPARHRAISEALNGFSLQLARFVVEDCYKGKLVYAGGDDVLAFVCVDDLLPAMTLLRTLYAGEALPADNDIGRLDSSAGYVRLGRQLHAAMGREASASCGAIIAHHQTPLALVLRELRAAEKRAKDTGGRDAFSLKILKRGGGAIGVTDKWRRAGNESVPGLIQALMQMLATPDVSRRAAYHAVTWLREMPPQPDAGMLTATLGHQFAQQGAGKAQARDLAQRLVALAYQSRLDNARDYLADLLMVAEFLARQSRFAVTSADTNDEEDAA